MAQSSINFERVIQDNLNHNDRTEFIEPDYLLAEKYRLGNEISNTAREAKQLLKNLLKKAGINFQEKFNQKLQAKSYLWEAVVNLNENHQMKDLKKLVKKLEKETGFTCLQISNHGDEGHLEKNKDGEEVAHYNYHAHLTFFTLDINNGLQLYRKDISKPERRKLKAEVEAKYALEPEPICEDFSLKRKWTKNSQRTNFRIRALIRERNFIIYNKERLSSLQTMVAEELGMERGTVSVESEAKKLGVEIVKAKTRMDHKAYKQGKKNEENSLLLVKTIAKEKELEVLLRNSKDSEIQNEAIHENIIRDMKVELEQNKQVLQVVKHLDTQNKDQKIQIESLENQNSVLATTIEEKETQIVSGLNTLKNTQEKIKVLEKQVQEFKDKEPEIIEIIKEVPAELTLEEIMQSVIESKYGSIKIEDMIEKQKEEIQKLTEPTGYDIEGESVSKKIYEYMEKERHELNYKSSRVESLEAKLKESKQRIVARDKLMNDQQVRDDQKEKEYRKKIEVLMSLVYSEEKYPIEFDENDVPIKFEKKTWKVKAESAEDKVRNLTLGTDRLSEKISELEDLLSYNDVSYSSDRPII